MRRAGEFVWTAAVLSAFLLTAAGDSVPDNPEEALTMAMSAELAANQKAAEHIYLTLIDQMGRREPDPLARTFRARAAAGLAHLYLTQDRPEEAEAPARLALTEAVGSTDYLRVVLGAAADLELSLAARSRAREALPDLLAIDAELKRRGATGSQSDPSFVRFYEALAAARAAEVGASGQGGAAPSQSPVRTTPGLLVLMGLPKDFLNDLTPATPPKILAAKMEVLARVFEKRFGPRHPMTGQVKVAWAAGLLASGDARGAFETAVQADAALRDASPGDTGSLKDLIAGQGTQAAISAILARSMLALGGVDTLPREATLAFEAYQRASDDETQRALRVSAAMRRSGDPSLSALLVRREAALARKRNAVSGLAAGRGTGGGVSALDAADDDIAAIDAALARDFSRFSNLLAARPVGLDEARGYLHADEAILVYQVLKDATIVWVLRSNRVDCRPLSANADELTGLSRRIRAGVDWLGGGSPQPFDMGAAYELYRDIFAPIEPDLQGVRHILLVPDGALATVPFHVLLSEPPAAGPGSNAYRDAPWLVRRYDFSTLPGIAALRVLRAPRPAAQGRTPFLGFGDPILGPPRSTKPTTAPTLEVRGGGITPDEIRHLPSLPETGDEVRAVGTALSGDPNQMFLRDRATIPMLRSLNGSGTLAKARVVLFATHAFVVAPPGAAGDPEGGLVLTPPAALHSDDNGFLTSSDVLGLRFDADWIVLSACNTAAESTAKGHPISGLARAFFYAGADALLISHWNVASVPAARLMATTFRMTANGETKAHALSVAMASLIDDPQNASYSHPAVWAPFFVVGD